MTAHRLSGPLQVERLNNGDRRLLRDLVIDLGTDLKIDGDKFEDFTQSTNGDTIITVPKGFVTDFSSIPTFARSFYRFDSVDLAGACHDRAYYVGIRKDVADEIWRLVAMSGERRVGKLRARAGWLALRIGGGFAYRSHEKRRQKRLARAS